MKAHPVADLFPMLAADELAELAEDIKTRGLLQPIVLDSEGRILDGRNRLEACEASGIEPQFVTYEGDDPDGYALAVNIARRSLSTGAKAIIAARAARLNGKSTRKAASGADLHHRRIMDANLLLDHAPDLADAVVAGFTPLSKALETARANKTAAQTAEKRMVVLREEEPKLAEAIAEETVTLDEAWRLRLQHVEDRRRIIDKGIKSSQSLVDDLRIALLNIKGAIEAGTDEPLVTQEMVTDAQDLLDRLKELL